jgi:hypothetical protein
MKITVLQPNLFPFKSYLEVVNKVDKVVFADDTYYNDKSWVNKTVLKKNGKKIVFRVPIEERASSKKICDLVVSVGNWRRNLLKIIASEYKESPNFERVFPVVKEIVKLPSENISHIAAYSVFRISELLGMETKFCLSSIAYKGTEGSFYKKIIKICKKEHSKEFVTFAMYRDTFNSDFFIKNNIKIGYYSSSSESNFSIIDQLMNDEGLFK